MKAVPNILSAFRIFLVPVFILFYALEAGEIKYIAVIIFITAYISDILDGHIARKYDAHTRLGRVLDPLADKFMLFTALVCLATTHTELIWVVCFYFFKEVLMGIGGILIEKKGLSEFPSSNIIGKFAAVVFFFATLAVFVLKDFPVSYYTVIFLIAVFFALIAFINYLYMFVKLMKNHDCSPETNRNDESVKTEIL